MDSTCMDHSIVPARFRHRKMFYGQQDTAQKNQELLDVASHPDHLYWHPMVLRLCGSPYLRPITRGYFPSHRLQTKLATAADLPVELFDLILSFVRADWSIYGKHKKQNKRHLGRVALVCRHWARTCQPKIFECITLRSHQDSLNIWSFVVRSNSVIPQSLQTLRLYPVDFIVSKPWIHVVCQKITSRMLHPDFSVSLTLESQGGPLKLALGKSIHASLPNRLPVFSSGIRDLTIQHAHFKSLEDLARLAGEMPSLESMSCDHVNWPPVRDQQPHLTSFITRRSQSSVIYEMYDCTDNAAAVLLSLQTVPVGRSRVGIDNARATYCIYRALPFTPDEHTVQSRYDFNNTEPKVLTVQMYNWGHLVFNISSHPLQQITSIDVQMQDGDVADATYFSVAAWNDFDTCVRELLDTEILEWVRFSFSTLHLLKRFADEIVGRHMPHLSGSNKVRYAVDVCKNDASGVVRPVTLEEIRDRKQRSLIYEELGLHIWDWEQVESDKPDSEDTVSDDEDFGEGSEGYHEPGSEGIEVDPEDNA